MSVLFALAAAVGWGSSDFVAGHARGKSSATSVVILTHLASVLVLIVFALDISLSGVGIDGSPTAADLGWGLAAGVAGGAGAMLLFRGLGKGSIAVVAPITATGAAAIPVLFGLVTGDAVTVFGIVGIALALVAIVLVSLTRGNDDAVERSDEPLVVPGDWSTELRLPVPLGSQTAPGTSPSPAPPPALPPLPTAIPGSATQAAAPRMGIHNGELRMPLNTVRQAVLALVATAVLSAAAIASQPVRQVLDGEEFTGTVTVQLVFALVIVGLAAFALNNVRPLFDFSELSLRRRPSSTDSDTATEERAPSSPQSVKSDGPALSWRAIVGQHGVPEALFSGIGFGLFFVFISRASEVAGHWPLVSARGISVVMFCLVALATRTSLMPEKGSRRPVVLAGVLDAAAATLFVLSARTGLLSVGAVLAALYPVITVLLARLIAKEHIRRQQMIGLGLALLAVALLAI